MVRSDKCIHGLLELGFRNEAVYETQLQSALRCDGFLQSGRFQAPSSAQQEREEWWKQAAGIRR